MNTKGVRVTEACRVRGSCCVGAGVCLGSWTNKKRQIVIGDLSAQTAHKALSHIVSWEGEVILGVIVFFGFSR